jgi:23S rRNA maturation-related 3'-5' exoribonuclease YhaM
MALTNDQMNDNKKEFIDLLRKINREGADIDRLINKLENSDFFYAPGSTKYHCAYEGGLCEHSLNVYRNFKKLTSIYDDLDAICYDEESVIIMTLLHDISKMNIYEKTVKNVKTYCEDGDKRDEMGRFKWVAEPGFKTKENTFVYGSHEMTSEFIARQFIPLTLDESVAILHHMGGMHFDCAQDNIGAIFSNYHAALILHLSDMLATYVSERE